MPTEMKYWHGANPAMQKDIAALSDAIPSLPDELLNFLRQSNGGEGELGLSPQWIRFYSAEEILEVYRDQFLREEFPNLLFFGTNGGLEMLAFDFSNNSQIVAVDPIAGNESEIVIASNFSEMIKAIGKVFRENA